MICTCFNRYSSCSKNLTTFYIKIELEIRPIVVKIISNCYDWWFCFIILSREIHIWPISRSYNRVHRVGFWGKKFTLIAVHCTLIISQYEWSKDKPFLLMHSRHARNLYEPKIKRIFEIAWTLFEIILFIHFYPLK